MSDINEETKKKVLALMADGETRSVPEIAELIGVDVVRVGYAVKRLKIHGQLRRVDVLMVGGYPWPIYSIPGPSGIVGMALQGRKAIEVCWMGGMQ